MPGQHNGNFNRDNRRVQRGEGMMDVSHSCQGKAVSGAAVAGQEILETLTGIIKKVSFVVDF